MKKVKQIVKQNSRAGYSLHNNIESEAKSGVPGGIRTHDPLLRSYTTSLVSTNFEAKLLFPAYPCFSFKTLIFNLCL